MFQQNSFFDLFNIKILIGHENQCFYQLPFYPVCLSARMDEEQQWTVYKIKLSTQSNFTNA